MSMKITVADVVEEEHRLLGEIEMYGEEDKSAERALHYICGAHDLASALIERMERMEEAEEAESK